MSATGIGKHANSRAVILNYSNPLWDGYCADPFVLRAGDFYYCYATSTPSSYGRQFALLRSKDLSNWEYLGGALTPMSGFEDAEHWAPEVCERDGRFWMYFSCNSPLGDDDTTQRLHVAVSGSPEGPFEVVKVNLFPDDGFTIDASPFHDPQSGKWFLFFARDFLDERVGTGTAVVELNDDMISWTGEVHTVVRASADWQVFERNRTIYGQTVEAWHTVEGAFVVFHEGQYVCFYAGGNWTNASYGVSFAVADSPLGPWLDERSHEGAFVLRGDAETIGPGHNSVVLAPDGQTHFCVYHSWNREGTKRQLCLDPIKWTSDGPKVIPTRGPQQLEL